MVRESWRAPTLCSNFVLLRAVITVRNPQAVGVGEPDGAVMPSVGGAPLRRERQPHERQAFFERNDTAYQFGGGERLQLGQVALFERLARHLPFPLRTRTERYFTVPPVPAVPWERFCKLRRDGGGGGELARPILDSARERQQ